MQIPGSVRDILQNKAARVCSISPDAHVFDAIQQMAEKNVGAILVMKGDDLCGILSERDYTRKVVLKGKSSKETFVREIMTETPLTASPHDSVEGCLQRMTEHRVRHLPVIEGGKVLGVVSIGDLVKWVISVQNSAISQLESYITGGFAG
jgi:CBS domain-containing protein